MNTTEYLKAIEIKLSAGIATEHTHRPALQALVESLEKNIIVTNEPKREKYGAPDFSIARGETPLGKIETKDIGVALDVIEKTDQMDRYLIGSANLVLTDYLEFRWYVEGEKRMTARLATVGLKGKLQVQENGALDVEKLLKFFLEAQIPTVANPKELAQRMARLAQLTRDVITKALGAEDLTDDKTDPLHDQLDGFRKVLLHDLSEEQFADMYAQTICYGLFASRCSAPANEKFTRQSAAYSLPKTNPFLRKMFSHIAGPDLDDRISWVVDDLAELLNRADIGAILKDFGKRTKQEDPVVHFYETFLAAYDKKMRQARGVYYTPEPVVSYIVRSVDHILKTDFGLADGLADATKVKFTTPDKMKTEIHKVLILDPATGTGTFLHSVVDLIHDGFKGNKGMWSAYVSQHLLPRLFGFELLMAPYAVAHMKLGLQLAETGYDFSSDERLRVYLTNTLEEANEMTRLPLFTQWLADEANAANEVKKDVPVMVVMGNPPYSGNSANTGEWISKLLKGLDIQTGNKTENYFEVDGAPLGEKNPKWLNDDYVKFIRFAQWRIEQTGYGVLAFISNNGYINNPTFRGMRQSLMNTFDDIYILDLHGNAKKKEKSQDGSKDENVFDIQQGVAIGIFVKKQATKKKEAVVKHAHLFGLRESKYKWLWENELDRTRWEKLEPQLPFYLFTPQNIDLSEEYEHGLKIQDIMKISSLGILSKRDALVVGIDWNNVVTNIKEFINPSLTDVQCAERFNVPIKDQDKWDISKSREAVAKTFDQSKIKKLSYRPFDHRFVYYDEMLVARANTRVMQHINEKGMGIIIGRQGDATGSDDWDILFLTNSLADQNIYRRGGGTVFPLYLNSSNNKGEIFSEESPATRQPNLSPDFIQDFSSKLGLEFIPDGKGDGKKTFGPEDAFYYMYAVFHAPAYRKRYAEFLKIDFPRLPLTSNKKLYNSLVALGEELVGLHLMERTGKPLAKFPEDGDNVVEKVSFTEPTKEQGGRVWINKTQYFEGVPPEVWEFHIGGYQVCQKWLKDRKGRTLAYDDLKHYQNIVSALAETIRLMKEVDEVIEKSGGWPMK